MLAGMRLAVLGAGGDTGMPLLRQALDLGYTVTAIVRDPSKLELHHARLSVVHADPFSADSLKPILREQDAVISALGFPKKVDGSMVDFTTSMAAILEAMRAVRLRRIVTISAWYTDASSRGGQPLFDQSWARIPGLVSTLDNEGAMERMLAGVTTDIDHTIVRVPTLTWDPPTGKPFMSTDGGHWVQGGSAFIPREDVANFMLSTLNDPERWSGKAVAIAIAYSDEEMGAAAGRFKAHMAKYTK
jgi:biliverdin reductase/flavin reductase